MEAACSHDGIDHAKQRMLMFFVGFAGAICLLDGLVDQDAASLGLSAGCIFFVFFIWRFPRALESLLGALFVLTIYTDIVQLIDRHAKPPEVIVPYLSSAVGISSILIPGPLFITLMGAANLAMLYDAYVMRHTPWSTFFMGLQVQMTILFPAYLYVKVRLTELRRHADASLLADAAKTELVANVSHELRTPLQCILGVSDLLAETALSSDQRQWINSIISAGEAMLGLVTDLLDFSKLEAGKMRMEREPTHLRGLVEQTLEMLQERVVTAGLELSLVMEPSVCDYFIADGRRIGQVLVNLVGNAVKFTESGGVHVRVSRVKASKLPKPALITSTKYDVIRFSVRDTGRGIAREDVGRLFKRFQQLGNVWTAKDKGTGLGLSICLRIVQLCGGVIAVDSTLGTGSDFFFDLPLERVDSATLIPGVSFPNAHSPPMGLGGTDGASPLPDATGPVPAPVGSGVSYTRTWRSQTVARRSDSRCSSLNGDSDVCAPLIRKPGQPQARGRVGSPSAAETAAEDPPAASWHCQWQCECAEDGSLLAAVTRDSPTDVACQAGARAGADATAHPRAPCSRAIPRSSPPSVSGADRGADTDTGADGTCGTVHLLAATPSGRGRHHEVEETTEAADGGGIGARAVTKGEAGPQRTGGSPSEGPMGPMPTEEGVQTSRLWARRAASALSNGTVLPPALMALQISPWTVTSLARPDSPSRLMPSGANSTATNEASQHGASEEEHSTRAGAGTQPCVRPRDGIVDTPGGGGGASSMEEGSDMRAGGPESASGSGPGSARPRVLCADDEAVNRMLAMRILQSMGIDADVVRDGEEAVKKFEEEHTQRPYALILLDLQMPKLSGFEVASEIRRMERRARTANSPKLSEVRIVAWSATSVADVVHKCRQTGFDDFVAKPARAPDVRRMLSKWGVLASPTALSTPSASSPSHVLSLTPQGSVTP